MHEVHSDWKARRGEPRSPDQSLIDLIREELSPEAQEPPLRAYASALSAREGLWMGESSRENLLVAKGVLGRWEGPRGDLIRILPSLNELFRVSMATIQPSPELVEVCYSHGIELITPESDWEVSWRDSLSTVLDSGRALASRAWRSCEGLDEAMSSATAIHLVSGDGSLQSSTTSLPA